MAEDRKGITLPPTEAELSAEFEKVLFLAANAFAKRCQSGTQRSAPLESWEIQRLLQGAQQGIVEMRGCEFLIAGQPTPYAMFSFNREYFTHFAMYVEALGWDIPGKRVELEYSRLDIVVFSDDQPLIGIEVKKSEQTGAELVQKMEKYLINTPMDRPERGDDALVKVKRLLEIRPKEFMVVTPERRWHFRVEFIELGMKLIPVTGGEYKQAA